MPLETTIAGAYPKIGDSTEEQKLRRAFHQFDKDEITEEALELVKNEVTEEVIRQQIEAGIDIVTDGLIRWPDPVTYLAGQISGYDIKGLIRYFDTNTFYREPIVASRLEGFKTVLAQDFQFAQEKSAKPVKAVITGPFTIAKLSVNRFYREFKQLAFDLAHIIQREAKALEDAGCRCIQFDEPALLHHKQDLALFFKIYEVILAQLSKTEKTLFLTFGNLEGIYPKILDLNVERIGCDLTHGHQNWDVFKKAQFTKRLMAGIVDGRNTKMETEADLVQTVHKLEESVNPDQLWISTNHSLEFLPRANARKKMELLGSVAKQLRGASVS